MKRRLLLGIGAVLIASLSFMGCKKYPDGMGPEYYTAPKDFAVKDNKFFVDSLGFENQKLAFNQVAPHYFTAEFSSRVDWTIKVTGLSSGAYKIIRGSSNKLDSTNSKWRGGHSGVTFFRLERCVAELSFLGSSFVLTDTFAITTRFNFNRINDGIRILSNANNNFNTFPLPFNDGQFAFTEGTKTYAAGTVDPETELPTPGTVNKQYNFGGKGSVEGDYAYYLAHFPDTTGKSQCDASGYFAGAIQHRYYGDAVNGPTNFLTDWSNPEDLWVNIYIYGDEWSKNTQIGFQLHEADLSNEVNKPIVYDYKGEKNATWCKARVTETYQAFGDIGQTFKEKHDAPSDDSYDVNIVPDADGWKLYSFPLKDLTAGVGTNAGNAGNKVKEPNRISRVQIALVARHPFQYCSMIVDYPTLTKGGPFNPDNY